MKELKRSIIKHFRKLFNKAEKGWNQRNRNQDSVQFVDSRDRLYARLLTGQIVRVAE